MVAVRMRIPLCPEDGSEMALQHRGFDLEEWYCDDCGQYRAVASAGRLPPEAPLDALLPSALRWVEREAPTLHGRISDEEGG